MKKIAGILVVLFILLTASVPSHWARTDSELSEVWLEKLAAEQELAESKEALVATEKTLAATKEILAETVTTLTATNQTLAATQTELTAALDDAKRLQAAVVSGEEKLAGALQEKERLKNQLANTDPVLSLPPPRYRGVMSYSLLTSTLKDKFPEARLVLRTNVKLIQRQDWELFMKTDLTNEKPYSLQDFNCTEYAAILQGKAKAWAPASAFGIAVVQRPGIDQSSYSHNMNFFLTSDGEILLLEPQDDLIFLPPENWRYILLLM